MKKIGRPFRRDVEFTGCCDAAIPVQSRLIQTLQRGGFQHTGPRQTSPGQPAVQKGPGPAGGAQAISTESLKFQAVKGYMEPGQEKSVVLDLSAEQQKKIEAVTGWKPAKVKVSVVPTEKSDNVELTADQKKTVEQSLGLEISSVTVAREPVEINLL